MMFLAGNEALAMMGGKLKKSAFQNRRELFAGTNSTLCFEIQKQATDSSGIRILANATEPWLFPKRYQPLAMLFCNGYANGIQVVVFAHVFSRTI